MDVDDLSGRRGPSPAAFLHLTGTISLDRLTSLHSQARAMREYWKAFATWCSESRLIGEIIYVTVVMAVSATIAAISVFHLGG